MATEQESKKTAQENFVEAYKALCLQHGYELKADVGLKQQMDGTYTIGARLTVVPVLEQPVP